MRPQEGESSLPQRLCLMSMGRAFLDNGLPFRLVSCSFLLLKLVFVLLLVNVASILRRRQFEFEDTADCNDE